MANIDITYEGDLKCRMVHQENGDVMVTDAPKEYPGCGTKFSPTDLLAASLGSCALTVMGIIAQKLGVDIRGTTCRVEKVMASTPPRRVVKIVLEFVSPQQLQPEVTEQLERALRTCPVHLSLHPDIVQEVRFTWGKK